MSLDRSVVRARLAALSSPRWALILTLAVFAFYLLLIPWTTLWDRDEPRFAQAAVEMVRSGQYLYPTFGGEVRAQKPILIYWLMAASIRVMGISEFSVRFWAPVGIAVSAYATYAIGRRLLSPTAGVIALLVVALNPLSMLEGTAATTDAMLMALTTTAVAAFVWRLRSNTAPVGASVLFAGGLACGLLAKGPVGLLPLLVVGGTLWAGRTRPGVLRIALEFSGATIVGLALFALWALPANAASGGRFYTQGFQHEIVGRVLSPLEGHGGPLLLWLPFYPLVLLIGFAPWSVYIPAALHALWHRKLVPTEAHVFLTWWIAGPIVAFSFTATHLPHYILPVWPAVSLATAAVIDAILRGDEDETSRRWLTRGIPIALASAMVACAVLIAAPLALHIPSLAWRSVPAILIVGTGAGALVHFHRKAQDARAFVACLAVAILSQAWIGLGWLPGIEQVKPVPSIAAIIRQRTPASVPVAVYGFGEPSLDFYLGQAPARLTTPDVVRWADAAGPGVLVTTRVALGHVGALPLDEVGSCAGFNVANGNRIELVALERRAQ